MRRTAPLRPDRDLPMQPGDDRGHCVTLADADMAPANFDGSRKAGAVPVVGHRGSSRARSAIRAANMDGGRGGAFQSRPCTRWIASPRHAPRSGNQPSRLPSASPPGYSALRLADAGQCDQGARPALRPAARPADSSRAYFHTVPARDLPGMPGGALLSFSARAAAVRTACRSSRLLSGAARTAGRAGTGGYLPRAPAPPKSRRCPLCAGAAACRPPAPAAWKEARL